MKTNYQFSNLLGATYKGGPVRFMPNGFTLLCSSGNQLKAIDLKRNISHTSRIESKRNVTNFAISPSGTHAFIISESGRCDYVNLSSDIVLHSMCLHEKVKALNFSPNSSHVAMGVGGNVRVYSIASMANNQFNPFILVNSFKHSVENVNSLDWSEDGRLIVSGGENRTVSVFAAQVKDFRNAGICVFGERSALVDTWFSGSDYNLICIDRSGRCSVWQCSHLPSQLGKRKFERRLKFIKTKSVNLSQEAKTAADVCATALNRQRRLLACAFADGVFSLFDTAEFTLLQNFRAGEQRIGSIHLNGTGDWLALGSGRGNDAQLLVWEWQSESYVLRQQSHSQTITSAAYSPDGFFIATGAEDGKVKIWDCGSTLCVVTFTEHRTGVTHVCFTQSGKALLSASLEGSVRAHDLKKYRNFRTLVAPKQTQLGLLCADSSGDLVMASSRDQFEIYIWALETGQLMETLTGHTHLVSGMATFENVLCSVSLDKTLKFWNILEGHCVETVQLLDEGLDAKYNPTGSLLAVLCYDANIGLFDTRNMKQIGTIETKLDIDAPRHKNDKLKRINTEKNKSFTCIAFSPNGQFLLAGGQSNVFCLYSVQDRLRIRSFRLSNNFSLDGTAFDVDYRKMTEFGNLHLFDLTDSDEEQDPRERQIKLPGTRHTNHSERAVDLSILISGMAFSPTGQDFAVVSSQGVHIFTVDQIRRFNPFQLALIVTPEEICRLCQDEEHAKALSLALRLNENKLVRQVIEAIPLGKVRTVVQTLGFDYAECLLAWIGANQTEPTPTKHFHFYLLLIRELLYAHGMGFKKALERNRPALTAIQQILAQQQNLVMRTCVQNMHSLEYLVALRDMETLKNVGNSNC